MMKKAIVLLGAAALVARAPRSAKGEPIEVTREDKVEVIDDMYHLLARDPRLDLPRARPRSRRPPSTGTSTCSRAS